METNISFKGKGMFKTLAFSSLLPICLFTILPFLASSCSDRDDHYEASHTAEGTLWQALEANGQVSNFTRVLAHCGYESMLSSSQMFTVFAPVDKNFSSEQADSVIELYDSEAKAGVKQKENTAIREFVKNHLALFNYSVYNGINDTITLINGKRQAVTDATIGLRHMLSENQRTSNGVLFTIDGDMPYEANVMEYLSRDGNLDSIAQYYNSHSYQVFVPEQSVAGSVVDGQTVYLDSVFTLRNELFRTIAPINVEDSTYLLLAPTDEEWTRLTNEYEQYYVFDKTIENNKLLQHNYARDAIVRGSVFSRTLNSDSSLQNEAWSTNASYYSPDTYEQDGKEYHYYQYPTHGGSLFAGAGRVTCSNGEVLKVSQWPISIYQTFAQTIDEEAESGDALKEVDVKTTRYPLTQVKVQPSNAFYRQVSGDKFVEIYAKSPSVRPSATFNLPNVLSNVGYDIYVVTVPALAGDTLATAEQRLPTKFRCTASWHEVNGYPRTEILNDRKDFVTTQDKIDVFRVAENFQFPTCSYGLSTPQVTLKIESRVTNSELNSGTYQRTIRIDRIYAVPHQEK